MRSSLALLFAVAGAAVAHAAPRKFEKIVADGPRTTTGGARFKAPVGWSISVDGPATVLELPEPDSHLALVDEKTKSADEAVAAAWQTYRPGWKRPLKITMERPARDGWDEHRVYNYETSPNERATVYALAWRHGDAWTILLFDGSDATYERRIGQTKMITDSLRPAGFRDETFAGKKAHKLDEAKVKAMREFVETARKALDVPGVAWTLVQDGKVLFAGGSGVRELDKPTPVDADSLFIVASNTKGLSTLMLARLVDAGRFKWDSPVTQLYPDFKLGDAATTKQVQVKHLVCACTGMPRQDYEWLFEFKNATAASEVKLLGTMQPTTKFGETYQYSNLLASVAGFLGAHVLHPDLELGAAYDRAMQDEVFAPLGMKHVTWRVDDALADNHASPHSEDADGKTHIAMMDINRAVYPLRPAGGLFTSARELTRYVQMELANGKLPSGARYLSEENLRARKKPSVKVGEDDDYGMGLSINHKWGVEVVHHGGSMIGYKSDMMWLPEHGVGAVILANSDNGGTLLRPFMRRLLELLFDGKPEAVEDVKTAAERHYKWVAEERKRLTIPPDAAAAAKLAARYANAALGEIGVKRDGANLTFNFGEWSSSVATRKNDDGTLSFVTTAPGMVGFRFTVDDRGKERALVVRDAQHEYRFVEAKTVADQGH